nr:putative TerB family tellurite resistance protein [uncultured bacterium]
MLKKLSALFNGAETKAAPSAHDLELAAAALLVEVCHADHDADARETAAIVEIAKTTLHLNEQEARQLLDDAAQRKSSATSLYEFTDLLNRHIDKVEKVSLVEDCWRVAFADGNIDRYEDHMIRKIAELLYVSHSDFIRAKLRVANSVNKTNQENNNA